MVQDNRDLGTHNIYCRIHHRQEYQPGLVDQHPPCAKFMSPCFLPYFIPNMLKSGQTLSGASFPSTVASSCYNDTDGILTFSQTYKERRDNSLRMKGAGVARC